MNCKTENYKTVFYFTFLFLLLFSVQKIQAEETPWAKQLIQVREAQNIYVMKKRVRVAVIDTGADVDHKSLRDHLWINQGEIANNQIDDDQNGFVDDVHGYNFVSNNGKLTDRHGHGTHVAGIITSIAKDAEVMVLKYYDPTQAGDNLQNTLKCLRYAIEMNADIINYSGGGLDKSSEEEKLIKQAQAKGILVVAAAGNEHNNSDIKGFYPANYGLSNILVVTAIDQQKEILASSNYGFKTVDLAAPGKDIISSLPQNQFGTFTGTSQATAFASGAAALLKAQRPDLDTAEKLISQLTKTSSMDQTLKQKTKTSSHLNVYRALAMQDTSRDAFGEGSSNHQSLKAKEFYSDSLDLISNLPIK